MKKRIIFFSSFLLSLASISLYAVNAETIYDDKRFYITSGTVSMEIPLRELSEVLSRFQGYRDWALKGIDGKDPRSRKFIGIMSDLIYEEENHKFVMVVDINLFWPFGSKGNKIYFDIITHYSSSGLLDMIEFNLSKATILVSRATLRLELYDNLTESRVNFQSKIKIAWFIDMFYTLKGFKKNFEVRIICIMRNLRELFGVQKEKQGRMKFRNKMEPSDKDKLKKRM